MAKNRIKLLLVLSFLLYGCSPKDSDDSMSTVSVYESKQEIQCDLSSGISIEESIQKLTNIEIDIIDSYCAKITGLENAAVCGAGTNSILVHEIRSSDLTNAEGNGFKNVDSLQNDEVGTGYKISDCSGL